MKITRAIAIFLTLIMCLGIITGCFGRTQGDDPNPSPRPTEAPTPTPPPPPTPTPSPEPVRLVAYSGNPEHLFFHEVIAYPALAFPNRRDPHNLDDYMLTVHEFNMVLTNLHQKNYVLVSMHDVWEEYTTSEGNLRMRRVDPFMIPEGKKPIVLSFDDLTFHLQPFAPLCEKSGFSLMNLSKTVIAVKSCVII